MKFFTLLSSFLLVFSLLSCETSKSESETYTITLHNKTDGVLSYVSIDFKDCGELSPGGSYTKELTNIPDIPNVVIYITYGTRSGDGYIPVNTINHEWTGKSASIDLVLPDDYFAFWAKNNTNYSLTHVYYNSQGISYTKREKIDKPINNDGQSNWVGFFKRSDIGNMYLVDAVSGLIKWPINSNAPVINAYGSYSLQVVVDNDPVTYTATINNKTEGFLKDVAINLSSCGEMAPNETCTRVFSDTPSQLQIDYKSASNIGDTTKRAIVHSVNSNTETHNLSFIDSHFSLWIKNESSGSFNGIGFNRNPDGYENSYSLNPPILNDDKSYWVGFFKRNLTNIELIDFNTDSYWNFNPIEPTANTDGSYSLRLVGQ